MDLSTIRTLIDYNEWATARLLTAAAQVDDSELRRARPGAGHGSICGQLHHIALSQIGLYLACLGVVPCLSELLTSPRGTLANQTIPPPASTT